jgi:hypothetical protein
METWEKVSKERASRDWVKIAIFFNILLCRLARPRSAGGGPFLPPGKICRLRRKRLPRDCATSMRPILRVRFLSPVPIEPALEPRQKPANRKKGRAKRLPDSGASMSPVLYFD